MARPSTLRPGVRAAGLPPPLLRLAPFERRLTLVPGRHLHGQHARHRPRGCLLRPAARATRWPSGLPGIAGGYGRILRLLYYGQHLGGRAEGVAQGEGIRVRWDERWGWLELDDYCGWESAVARWVRGGDMCTLIGGLTEEGASLGLGSPLLRTGVGGRVLAMNRTFHTEYAGMRIRPSCALAAHLK